MSVFSYTEDNVYARQMRRKQYPRALFNYLHVSWMSYIFKAFLSLVYYWWIKPGICSNVVKSHWVWM